jgi:polysaccharide export outer membrane protein
MAASCILLVCLTAFAEEIPSNSSSAVKTVSEANAAESNGTYILQPRDVLEIRVYNLPEVSETVAIRPDGNISVPLLNEITAAGQTAAKLSETLTEGYKHEFRNPRVTVIVRSFSNQNIFVGGEVDKPGLFPLEGNMTVLQAVLRAGGIKLSAKEKAVVLLRNDGHGNPQVRKLNLVELVKGQPDVVLQPFDVVFVPKSKIAKADQWVDQNIRKLIPFGLGLDFSYLLNGQTTIF